MGTCCLKSWIGLCKASLAHPLGETQKLFLNSPTPIFVYGNLISIKKTLGDFVLIFMNLWFGTKPMISFALLYVKHFQKKLFKKTPFIIKCPFII